MRIAIIGMGLIGTSVALAARRAWPSLEVTAIDRGQPIEAAEGAETIVLAAPVEANIDILTTHGRRFAASIVTDVGSTKRSTVAAARAAGLTNFVGGHPMAGAAASGPAEAREDLFDDKPWFLVAGAADARTFARVRSFVEALRARVVVMSDDGGEHDSAMAAVSHLPQVVASLLMGLVGTAATGRALEWAGKGLRDTTRLAACSPEMWASVLRTNSDNLRPLVLSLADHLRKLANTLDDPEAVRRVLAEGNEQRERLIETRRKD